VKGFLTEYLDACEIKGDEGRPRALREKKRALKDFIQARLLKNALLCWFNKSPLSTDPK
jgi:hypothetical protein